MEDLKEIYEKMETEELIHIVTIESVDYQESSLRIAMDELKRQGIEIGQEKQPIPKDDDEKEEQTEKEINDDVLCDVSQAEDVVEPLVDLYYPRDAIDLMFLKSIFDAEGIEYVVRGDMFGSIRIGPQVPMYNERTFIVSADQLARAKELLQDFLNTVETTSGHKTVFTINDKLRVIFELLLFGWFIPGRPYF